jgi:hypothetical protein
MLQQRILKFVDKIICLMNELRCYNVPEGRLIVENNEQM